MLPQLIHHSYTRSTRDVVTNFPHGLTTLYNSLTPRALGKQPVLPPLPQQTPAAKTATKLKAMLQEQRIVKDLQKHQLKKDKIFKGKIAETLYNSYNIYISYKDICQLTVEQIAEKALYLHRWRELNEFATKIQNHWKTYWFNKGRKVIEARREGAAIKIQASWRRYKKKIILPRLRRIQETNAAVVIQRYYRGYRSRMRYLVIKGRIQIQENMKFFEEVRAEVIKESVLIIQRFWRKYNVIYMKAKKAGKLKKGKQLMKKAVRGVRAANKFIKKSVK